MATMMTLSIFPLLILCAIGTGHVFLAQALKWSDAIPVSLRVGAAYFIGIAWYVSMTRTLAMILGRADWAAWITMASSAILCLVFWRKVSSLVRELMVRKEAYCLAMLVLLCSPLFLAFWLPPDEVSAPAYMTVGSLHSVRYAWIANFASACGVVPVLGQNTGQSMLAFMAGTVLGSRPFVFLFLWLYFTIVFLGIYVYGFVRQYERRAGLALMATVMFMFGNTALSISHILVNDSGSPFAQSGYTDTLFGVWSVLMLVCLHSEAQKREKDLAPLFAVVVLVCIAAFFMAPQNILYLAALVPLLAVCSAKRKAGMRLPMFWSAACLLAGLVAVPQGGMLTPKQIQANIPVPGLMNVHNAGTKHENGGVVVAPGVPFHYGSSGKWWPGHTRLADEISLHAKNGKGSMMPVVWLVEQALFVSLRVLFFPIVGLAVLFWMCRRKKMTGNSVEGSGEPAFDVLAVVGIYTFILGFILAFSIALNGYKWEIVRFLIPGITIGMLGISLFGLDLLPRKVMHGKMLFAALCVAMLCGPVSDFALRSFSNLQSLLSLGAGVGRLQWFLGAGPEIGQAFCHKIMNPQ